MSKRLTGEEFRERFSKLDTNIELLGEYVDMKHRIHTRCKVCGAESDKMPQSILQGHGCARCAGNHHKSNDEFVEQLSTINPTITPLEEYSTSKARIMFRCETCGNEWSTAAANVLSGRGCPECGKLTSAAKRRKTTEQVIAELAEKNPTIQMTGEYRYAREKTTFRCLKCGDEFEATPDNMLRGKGCPKCRYTRARETRRRNAAAKRNMNVDFSAARRNVDTHE